MSDSNADLILHRLGALETQQRAVEGKLDRILERHEARIDALEGWRDTRTGELKVEKDHRGNQAKFMWSLAASTAFLFIKGVWDLIRH